MKKLLIFLLVLALSIGLCACKQKDASASADSTQPAITYTFPANTTLLGVDISGLTAEVAWTKLEAAAAGYTLELLVDGVKAVVSAKDIDLVCAQDVFSAGAEMMAQNMTPDFSGLVRFNEGKLRTWLRQNFNKEAVEATIVYEETVGQYVFVPSENGQKSDPNLLLSAAKDTICNLTPQLNLTDFSQILKPTRVVEDAAVTEALAMANKMIGVKLSYVFAPDGDETTVKIPDETIRSFITLDEDGLTSVINDAALNSYVAELGEQYSMEGTSGDFLTTYGSYVGLTVEYEGHYVDTEELAEDIAYCMKEGISETRTAPYLSRGDSDMAYGGTYVELNLDAQHLWYYKNGDCLVSADIVSGKVAEGWLTPNGVFSLYDKETNARLEGEDYWALVSYWMPFYGGYGLHDGTWHSTFGGTVYYYEGSHGCVNMPLWAAAEVYENITIGTKVIIYGGASSCPPMRQSFTGTTSYDVAEDEDPFKLDIKPVHSKPNVTYKSNNTKVATVSSNGTVTIKGVGKAEITVTAEEHKFYTEATTTVTVNVHSACDEGRHKLADPVTEKKPTCQPGLQTTKCKKCDYVEEKELPAVKDHSFDQWKVITEATCAEEGLKERVCTICKTEKQTKSIPVKDEHTDGTWVTVKAPTCVDEGSKELKCSICETTLDTETIPATGEHTPGDWITDIEPTCTSEGHRSKSCTSCGALLESEPLDVISHSFGDGPTCNNCDEPNPNYTQPPAQEITAPVTNGAIFRSGFYAVFETLFHRS